MSVAPQQNTPSTIVIRSGGGLQSALLWLGWLGCLVFAGLLIRQYYNPQSFFDTTGGVQEKFVSGESYGKDKIAIITISGVILEGQGYVRQQIERVRRDNGVKAIVVRVNSPGGTVTGSDYIYHHLVKLRDEKNVPLVVSMGSIAASGGYYVSMAVGDEEKSIFAEPTTTTGSIGVIIPHYDISQLLSDYNIKDDSIVSGPHKQMLSMTRTMDDEQRELLQEYVDESFDRFKSIVKSGRPAFREDESQLDALATGRILTAAKAKQGGLVDEIGFLEDAVARAAELAGLDVAAARVVRYQRLPSVLDIALAQTAAGQSSLESLMERSTPRAYYMATTLPPLVTPRAIH